MFGSMALLFVAGFGGWAGEVTIWLDELTPSQVKQDFGSPQSRQTVMGKTLCVAGCLHGRGLGVHSRSSLKYDLRGQAKRFSAQVGVDDEAKTNPGSVEFLVLGDGKPLWQSGLIKGGEQPKLIDLDLSGIQELELRVTDGGDGIDSDHADWLDAQLIASGSLDHLFPLERRSPQIWNQLSNLQLQRGFQLTPVAPGTWRLRLGKPEPFTPSYFRENPVCTNEMQLLDAVSRLPVQAAAIGFKTNSRGCVLELPMQPGERIYGLGLNLKVFDPLNGRRTIRVSDDQGTVLGDSHAPVPFYVSTLGYGIYVDSARYVSFYLGNLDPVRERSSPSFPAGQAAPGEGRAVTETAELYRPRPTTGKVMVIDIPAAQGIDLYFFGGPDLRQAVQRYNLFSGGGCRPPLWGLGGWYRASTELGQKEVQGFLQEFRERHIPCTVFGLEPGWHSHAYSCSFSWSKAYPDPDGLLAQARAGNYHLNLWEHAFTHPSSPLYQPLLPYSGDYKVWSGLVPDFATSEARRIFRQHHERQLIDKGVAGFKLDECDHQPLSATPWSFPECSQFPSGLDGEQMHLLLGPLYQQTLLAPFRQRNQRTFGLVRASHALAAPLPYVVYSDAYDHRDYVRGLATSGFAGVLWCPEVRDMASLEEFYRRLETCVFSPLTQIDCWYLKNPVWKQINKNLNNSGRFMDQWEKVEAVCRRLLELRMSLIPYLYGAFGDYQTKGLPPVRALVMDFPEDPHTWSIDDQYLFGPSMLVAPLFTGQKQRVVYLPRGEWFDFWTQEKFQGGRKIEISKPLDQIPVFVKANSLVPMAKPVEFIDHGTCFEVSVRVFGETPLDFILWEDDGDSWDYEKGIQNRLTLKWSAEKGGQVVKTGVYSVKRFEFANWMSIK